MGPGYRRHCLRAVEDGRAHGHGDRPHPGGRAPRSRRRLQRASFAQRRRRAFHRPRAEPRLQRGQACVRAQRSLGDEGFPFWSVEQHQRAVRGGRLGVDPVSAQQHCQHRLPVPGQGGQRRGGRGQPHPHDHGPHRRHPSGHRRGRVGFRTRGFRTRRFTHRTRSDQRLSPGAARRRHHPARRRRGGVLRGIPARRRCGLSGQPFRCVLRRLPLRHRGQLHRAVERHARRADLRAALRPRPHGATDAHLGQRPAALDRHGGHRAGQREQC